MRKSRTGRPLKYKSAIDKFEALVLKLENGCHELSKTEITHNGYSRFCYGQEKHIAHIFIYIQIFGNIDGLQVHHKCKNRRCVNIEHLEALTPKEHVRLHAALITHCPQGHEYSEKNTYYRPNGGRRCKTCEIASVTKRQKLSKLTNLISQL